MTPREVSEKVRDHLTQQCALSKSDKNVPDECAYRSDTGGMCAVGCLITDEVYEQVQSRPSTAIEGKVVGDPRVLVALDMSFGVDASEFEGMLLHWQQYHDGTFTDGDDEQFRANYEWWIKNGDVAHSPAAVHEHIFNNEARLVGGLIEEEADNE